MYITGQWNGWCSWFPRPSLVGRGNPREHQNRKEPNWVSIPSNFGVTGRFWEAKAGRSGNYRVLPKVTHYFLIEYSLRPGTVGPLQNGVAASGWRSFFFFLVFVDRQLEMDPVLCDEFLLSYETRASFFFVIIFFSFPFRLQTNSKGKKFGRRRGCFWLKKKLEAPHVVIQNEVSKKK